MRRSKNHFQTIRSEGAILPPDILRRIADLSLEGLDPQAYHLQNGARLNEAIAQSWTRVLQFWREFEEARALSPESDRTAGGLTRERWLLPLFQELGYGRLTAKKAPEIEGRLYPIERLWNHLPLHLIGCKLSLDRRVKGVRGAATATPHSLVQEFLNRSDGHLWAFLSNGLQLRVLRDNLALSRQAYVEFDLESMLGGEVYADFTLLWLVCHQSRLETDRPEDTWLERWSGQVREQGTRVLEELRVGVTCAIESLGQGFLDHRQNEALRRDLRDGVLSAEDYYRQLLRIVYRLLFLFVAEDRNLLFPAVRPSGADLFDSHYSTSRLRRLADSMHGGKHADLWHALTKLFRWLWGPEPCSELGLPALGSFLFDPESTAELTGSSGDERSAALINNQYLLDAVRALSFVEQNGVRRQVDYRNLGSEELGSVYESLLELHPSVNTAAAVFSLGLVAGSERKASGSYYTHDSLVQSLLDSALEPVVEDRLRGRRGRDAEEVVLGISVCDPAVGSGHFLIAAGHRLARRLALIRTGEDEPTPEDYRSALRDVVSRCLYGVDINPMAAELCRVALWMEALEPGMPLSFLDHHIQVGNSLVGATPELLSGGIPAEAFEPIEGDDKAFCRNYRRRNDQERAGQRRIVFGKATEPNLARLADEAARIGDLADDDVVLAREKERRYREFISSEDFSSAQFSADAWCAAFLWEKRQRPDAPEPLTEGIFRQIHEDPAAVEERWLREVNRIAKNYRPFHWHLAFPEIFLPGVQKARERAGGLGFDVVLGNPPWDQVQFREQEFFAGSRPDIANSTRASFRKEAIAHLEMESPALFSQYLREKRKVDSTRSFAKNSGAFPLTARGRMNTFALFTELKRRLVHGRGRVGCVVPSGVATYDTTKLLFQNLVENGELISLFDFENRKRLFPAVHLGIKFCLLTLNGAQAPAEGAEFAFFLHSVDDLADSDRRFKLTAEDFERLNPNTRTCPIFRSRRDAEIARGIYERIHVLVKEGPPEESPWGIRTKPGLFNMATSSDLFHSTEELRSEGYSIGDDFEDRPMDFLPLYEGKMFDLFDHRAADVVLSKTAKLRKGQSAPIGSEAHRDPNRLGMPRYWVATQEVESRVAGQWNRDWIMGWKEITASTNHRTLIPIVLPLVGVGHKIPVFLPREDLRSEAFLLLAVFSSFCCDYVARLKLGDTSLTPFTLKQLPVPGPDCILELPPGHGDRTLGDWLRPRVLELVFTSWDLAGFARDLGYDGAPFIWDESRRFEIRSELDAACFHLYGRSREEVDYILETFPIVRRLDVQTYGQYRTKKTILDVFDRMQHAMERSTPYKTALNPPPADVRVAHSASRSRDSS